ncbi:Cell wall-associated hydrolase, NlpC family [Sinosporangium album]|uniref:Cell wall-associated hydrolase, NlpC family n=1 Tax=Sinosporangium album TaxID=504805 RepID=A0A1G7XLH8_9ACTN|nr:C40 family peptidase [Sinosporangium album]SDG85059.1 Cell wall-associated hydrolase, NlpC family [Sinosporangium album]
MIRLGIGGAALSLTASAGAIGLTAPAQAMTPMPPNPPVVTFDPADALEEPSTAEAEKKADKKADDAKAKPKAAAKTKKISKVEKQKIKAKKAIKVAKQQVGDPYRYGATGPNAFDCSGLLQFAWRKAGIKLPRTSYSMFRGIDKKVSWKSLKPGDLMFFHGKGHVAMYIGKNKIVHSPSSGKTVRIEKLSSWRKRAFSGAVRPGL